MLYIGIDLGTSAVKLLLMEEDGSCRKTVSREYPLSFPQDGWAEQSPEDWWDAVCDGLGALTDGCDKSKIGGVSFGGQMHGLVILDEQDRVIRPAILWNDGRCEEECAYLNQVIGREALTAYTGNIAFAGFTAPKILWVKKHEPEHFARIRKIMLPKDYLAYRMTGVHASDRSDASGTLLLDVKHRRWSKEMLVICGVDEAVMPTLFESSEVIGTLTRRAAAETGLPVGIKVAAGAGDNAAAAVGTGTVGEGGCNLSLGTSGTVFISQDKFSVDANNALHSFAHADGKYHLMGCILSAASCNKWWLEDILTRSDYAASQAEIEMEREHKVFFLPYLMGERSPHNDAAVRGAFLGLSLDTTQADMTRAVLEGVAFALRDSIEVARSLGIELQRATICGGGARSPLWCEMIANICKVEIVTPEKEEGPALGAAMLAAVACGAYRDVQEAAERIVRFGQVYRPTKAHTEQYQRKYEQFVRLYPAVKNLY